MASKIYPFGIGNSLEASFKLLLVAEGFTSTQRGQFAALCVDLVEALLSTTPFNRTRARPEWLSVIMAFSASAGAGPRLGSVGASSTVLGSYIDTSTNRLVVDHAQLTTLLQAQVITTETGTQPLSDYFSPGGVIYGITGGLIAVITPAVSNPAAGPTTMFSLRCLINTTWLPPRPTVFGTRWCCAALRPRWAWLMNLSALILRLPRPPTPRPSSPMRPMWCSATTRR